MPESLNTSSDDLIKIMVATDCHLGYGEDDPIIGEDSFVTFEEILILAVENNVDMILLGGDLFHHNNPTQRTLNKCLSLLRQYTMGDNSVYLELLSEAPSAQPTGTAPLNYYDRNLNVSIPVFSIHGNHDDPSGPGQHSSMDTLASAGVLNYFGKWTDLNKIHIRPILLKKGKALLALYGLSHIKDERLSRLFIEKNVMLVRPSETPNDWFNVFVLHQNRADRGPKKFISESYLPGFLDFIIWGHEHDCYIEPERSDQGFYVVQPGSSVPTSLSEGEARPKHVGILEIGVGKTFRFVDLKLQTTRPFVWANIRLMDIQVSSQARERKSEEIRAACYARVEEMIKEAEKRITGHPKQPTLPLVRLRCEYNDESQLFNLVRFGQSFYKRVANPDTEVIRVKKVSEPGTRRREHVRDAKEDIERLREIANEAPEAFTACAEAIVEEYFRTNTDKQLLVLSVKGMASAVDNFLNKDAGNAIKEITNHQVSNTKEKLMAANIDHDTIKEELERIRNERETNVEAQERELRQLFEARFPGRQVSGRDSPDEVQLRDSDDDLLDDAPLAPAPSSQRKSQQSTITSLFGGRAKPKFKNNSDEEDFPPSGAKGRGGRGRGNRGGRGSSSAGRGRAAAASSSARKNPAPDTSISSRAASTRKAALASQAMIQSSIAYETDSE